VKEARVIIIGDSDFPGPFIQQTNSRRNLDFLTNAALWLSNDDDIISIRSRAGGAGRLDKIRDEEKRASRTFFARAVGMALMPLLVVVLGLLITLGRRKRVSRQGRENGEAANV
jgi:ABC-type uncharacterized transport system involved in gliding motility auxiliary subunit